MKLWFCNNKYKNVYQPVSVIPMTKFGDGHDVLLLIELGSHIEHKLHV